MKQIQHTQNIFQLSGFTNPNRAKRSHKGGDQRWFSQPMISRRILDRIHIKRWSFYTQPSL